MILETRQPESAHLELRANSVEAVKVTLEGPTEFGVDVGVEIEVCAPLKALFFTFPKGRLYATDDGRFIVLCGRDEVLAEEIVIGKSLSEMLQGEKLNLRKIYVRGDDDDWVNFTWSNNCGS